jgi:putative ABC transport system ATP-binding protein
VRVIQLSDIVRTYARPGQAPVHALAGVSLEIARGDFLAIIGTSGSGKSTLMNVLGLLDRADGGRYLLDGADVTALDVDAQARVRNRRLGFVFQAFHLLPRTTALENVELPLVYSDREDIAGLGLRALEQVGLADRATHHPSELSGGQQQRVAIARALVNEPDLVLADEPTGNLDARSAGEVLDVLEGLSRAGRTIVLVTHDPAVAARCTRVARLEDGRLLGIEERRPAAAGARA